MQLAATDISRVENCSVYNKQSFCTILTLLLVSKPPHTKSLQERDHLTDIFILD